MVFYGAGGHAKVIIEAFLASGGKVTAIIDDDLTKRSLLGFHVSGRYERNKFADADLLLSIGSNQVRKKLALNVTERFGVVVHPQAVISPSVFIGSGSVIMAGVVANAEVQIGSHVILNTGAIIEHDCVVGDFVHISPNATICGGVRIGEGTHVGAGATVIQDIKVGKWATIGAGTVVIENVPDYAVVVGVPGILKKFNKPVLD